MPEYTPGPWYVVEEDHSDDSGNGPVSLAISTYEDDSVDAIAWINTMNPNKTEQANARLIAAAPDMLAALQRIQKDLRDGPIDGEFPVRDMVDAAVSKATGES